MSATGTTFFFALVGAVAAERVFEMLLSLRNARRAFARGGVEAESRRFYLLLVVVHVLILAAGPLEVVLFARPFVPPLAIVATWIVCLTMALRYWAIFTLGERWNTRVIVIPGLPPVASGPYRFVRHPNYVAVTIEVATDHAGGPFTGEHRQGGIKRKAGIGQSRGKDSCEGREPRKLNLFHVLS